MKDIIINFLQSHYVWLIAVVAAVVSLASEVGKSILSDLVKDSLISKLPPIKKIKLWRKLQQVPKNEYIRISAAYLLRIRLDNNYLLVKGHRVKKFQPVGGAFQRYPNASKIINKLGILDDNKIEIDDINRGDLRVRVPARNVIDFLKWFDTGKDRETTIEREFREELLKTDILPTDLFEHPKADFLYECLNFHFSTHYQCRELLVHQVYEIHLNDAQREYLRSTLQHQSSEWIWASEEVIRHLGYEGNHKLFEIGDHTPLLISKNNNLFTH
ncbi:hypothetical protein [Runella zeae]|uniref:SMODS-associated NUDIX domain-containing protein n=1 Tax=Runella zeae TaxID=94255 RepID=UPI0023568F38|nr:hypothetical protein [Runella zeae]